MFQSAKTHFLMISKVINRVSFCTDTDAMYMKLPSALYVNCTKVFSAVRPHIDISLFEDIKSFHLMMKNRGEDINMKDLVLMKSQNNRLKQITKDLLELDLEINKCIQAKSRIPKEDPNMNKKSTEICTEMEQLVVKLKIAKSQYSLLGESFALPYLKLPNTLNHRTGTLDSSILTHLDKPSIDFTPKTHMELCTSLDQLSSEDVSINSLYLKGKLAILELGLTDYLLDELQDREYSLWSNIDLVKAVTVEGCGMNVEKDVYELEDANCKASSLRQYLVGGSSLPAFVALFSKRILNPSVKLPYKFVTSGKNYQFTKPKSSPSLFDCSQTMQVSTFIAYSHSIQNTYSILNDVTKHLSEIYSAFNIHFTVIKYSSLKLKSNESLAIGIQMFVPSTQVYEEVARVSVLGDYVSKRLQCWEGKSLNTVAALGFIYVEIMNINKFIACLVENNQKKDGNYELPPCLHPYII